MASIDFPNSPTDGQTFTSGNATYTYIAAKGYWDAVTTTSGIQLTSLSVGAEAAASGDGAISYNNTTGVFTYTPPVISAGGIALTDLSVGAENPADGDGAISYNNTTGVFTYTPPVVASGLPTQSNNAGAFLTTDGSSASWDTLVTTTIIDPQLAATLVNPNDYGTSASDQFGAAVTTDGTNVYVVAAEAGAPNGGRVVYVYNASTKAYLYTVTAPIVTNGFGYPYARANDGYLVVPTEDIYITPQSGNNVGRVHIFNSADGSFVRTISRVGTSTAWSSVGNDGFGVSFGTANGKTIVGAYYGGLQGATRPAGEALLYDNATGSLLHTFSNPSSPVVDEDGFGAAVAMANNYILIGAMGEDQAGTNFGVVYVYDATTYALIRTITPSAGIFMGWDIILDTTGEYFYSPFSSNVGKVYEIATGTVALTISPPAGATAAWGVNGFAMTEEYVIIADPSYNTYGRVHYYNKTTGAQVFTVDSPASSGTLGLGYHSITSVGTSVFVSNKNATGGGNTNSGEIYVIEPSVTRTFSDDVAFTGAVTIGGVAPLTLTDISVGAEAAASGDGAISYDNTTGVFTYTPPVISGGIALTDFSVGAEAAASGDGAISYNNTTGVFTYTPPVISAGGIALTDLSVGAENPADGDGAISYNNTTGVFTYTPPVVASGLPTQSNNAGAFLTTDGSSASWDTLVTTTIIDPQLAATIVNTNPYGASTNDRFGIAISTDGTNVYIISADPDAPNGPGAIYAYNASTKAYLYTITSPVTAWNFGYNAGQVWSSTAAKDGYLVATSGNAPSSVHIFNTSDGSFVRTIARPAGGGTTTYEFGGSVDTVLGKTIIGDYYYNNGVSTVGRAYLYDNATGNLLHTFENPNPNTSNPNDSFGRAVKITSNYIVIAAMQEDIPGIDDGVIHIFDANTYTLIRTISTNTAANEYFGWNVHLDTTGEYVTSNLNGNQGKIYEIATGALALTISAPAGRVGVWGYNNGFAMNEEYVIIADDSFNTYGRLHYYDKTTGSELFTVNNPKSAGQIGKQSSSMVLVGDSLFVSNEVSVGTGEGEVYVIEPSVTRTFSDDVAFTGAVTIGGAAPLTLTDLSVGAEAAASGDGGIAYDNTTGVFTYTPPVVASGVDTASVEAAGALMDSELTDIVAIKALDQGVATTDSPTFAGLTLSGVPTAPTAAAGTSTTQIATTEFTTTAIANLVDTAPATLDTLNELAAALGDDSNFATTVANSLALKAPLISPSFTGPVTVTGTTALDGITTLSTTTEKTSLPEDVSNVLEQEIVSSDPQANDWFGTSVSISSDGLTAIVGAKNEDTGGTDTGAAYIYTKSGSTWSEQAKIQASDKQAYDNFGVSVSISSDGNTAIVGAQGEGSTGSAYIFTRSGSTWSQQAKIQASDAENADNFGISVSISSDGNTVLVGAYYEDTGGSNAGAAYIFIRTGSTWAQQAKIVAGDPEAEDQFGESVSISGDGNTAIVNGRYEDTGGTNAGAAYIFVKSGTSWTQQAKIQATDIEAQDIFGESVSISGDGNTVLVGATTALEDGFPGAGAAYFFTRSGSTWTQAQKIVASDPGPDNNSYFGSSVSISSEGNKAIIGAMRKTVSAAQTFGVSYIFTKSGSTWTETQKIQASNGESGDHFGESVSMSSEGSTVIVGASGFPYGRNGSAYMYTFENYSAHDISQSSVFTHSGLSDNFTANFTNVPTTNDRTTEIELVIEQGATGYLPTVVQIDGVTQTIVWQNGFAPTASTNAKDIISFNLIRSADTWTVLGEIEAYTSVVTTLGTTTEKSSALTGATGVVAHDITSNSLFVHSSVAADFTANFTNVPTTDDRTISVALIINQGATGYLPTAVQIDGVAQTILWQTATAPTATTSATDIASFTLIRSAGAWSVLGTVTAFGSV